MKRPKKNIENTAILVAITVTLILFYSIFIDEESNLKNMYRKPAGILTLIIILGFFWGWVIYSIKAYSKSYWKWIAFLKESDVVNTEVKETVIKYENSFKDGVITKDELFDKLIPIGKVAEKQLQEVGNETRSQEHDIKVEKIKKAYADGILTKTEMEKKITELN